MIPLKDITAQVGELTPDELERIKLLRRELENLEKSKKINEENLQRILNISSEVRSFTELFFWRLISGLKQHHMMS